jgi:hypothetical protein
MKHLKSHVNENGGTVIELSATDLNRLMTVPSNAVEHYHPLRIVRAVARRMCERGYHRLSYGYSAPPEDLFYDRKISNLEKKILHYNACCSVCAQAYFDAETERHKEGLVLVPQLSYQEMSLEKINESQEFLDIKKEQLPKQPMLETPEFSF